MNRDEARRPEDMVGDEGEELERAPRKRKREDDGEVTVVLPPEETGHDTEPTVLVDAADETGTGLTSGRTELVDPSSEADTEPTILVDDDRGGVRFADTGSQPTEDMFVVLPEQLADEIPVVDTEVVEEFRAGPATEAFDTRSLDSDTESYPTELAEDVGLVQSNPADEEFDPDERPTQIVDEEGLDELATDLDDEVLADTAAADSYAEDYDDGGSWDEPADYETGAPSRSGGKRVFVGVAAAALILGALGFVFYPELKRSLGMSEASATGGVVQNGGGPGGVDGAPGTSGGEVGVPAVDPAVDLEAYRREFSEKMGLALDLGFGGTRE